MVPYLYRYFVDDVSKEQNLAIFEWEQRLIAVGADQSQLK
jgi:hypothetical protein